MSGLSDAESQGRRTVASTNIHESRKASTVNEDAISEDEDLDVVEEIEEELEEEYVEEGG